MLVIPDLTPAFAGAGSGTQYRKNIKTRPRAPSFDIDNGADFSYGAAIVQGGNRGQQMEPPEPVPPPPGKPPVLEADRDGTARSRRADGDPRVSLIPPDPPRRVFFVVYFLTLLSLDTHMAKGNNSQKREKKKPKAGKKK